MPEQLTPPRQSMRSRLLALSGATIFLCICVMLLFFPLLAYTLQGLMERTVKAIQEEKGSEATTIARLTVMEFSHLKDLPKVEAGVKRPIDQLINQLLWEKVTFNKIIEGIELIHAPGDSEGRYLTYWYYRREDPELTPMFGPEKGLKKFSGLEWELIDIINKEQRVDKTLLESVNQGPKGEGDMLLRYFPLYVPEPDLGAIYWGVAKIGIDVESMRHMLLIQSQEQSHIRNAIWLEIGLSLVIAALLAVVLVNIWIRNQTRPLMRLSRMAQTLQADQTPDLELWVDNLKRVDLRGQAEVTWLRQILMRLAQAIQKTGQKLVGAERQACLGRVAGGIIPALKTQTEALQELQVKLQENFQNLVNVVKVYESLPSITPALQAEMRQVRQQLEAPGARLSPQFCRQLVAGLENLEIRLRDLERFLLPPEPKWESVTLTTSLTSVLNLITPSLTPGVEIIRELGILPPIWGCRFDLEQGFLYLLDYAIQELEPGGELALRTYQPSPELAQISLSFSGRSRSETECQELLKPFRGAGEVPASLGPALAAAIFRQHGGDLTVRPREEGGLIFLAELPAAQVRDESPSPSL
jgi:signal transduction histidine kinase